MAQSTQFLGVAATASFILQRYAPEYSLGLLTTTFVLFLAQYIGYLVWALVLYPRFFSPFRDIPTPPGGEPVLGHTREIIRESSGAPMRKWVRDVPNDGLIRYTFWGVERLLLTSPKMLGEVLVTRNYDFIKPPRVREALGRVLGVGILLAEGDEHKLQRKNLMPAFSYRHVKELVPTFWDKSRELVECVTQASKSETRPVPTARDAPADPAEQIEHAPGAIEVGHWASRATLDIIGLAGMGKDFNALQNPDNELHQAYAKVFSPGRVGRLLQLAGAFIPFWILRALPVQRNADVNSAVGYVKKVSRDIIAQKRLAMSEKKSTSDNNTPLDIVSVALESGGFTDEDLVNQMMTFLAAGHETTATSTIWAIYMLCKHPTIQTKLRSEIRSTLPPLSSPLTAADLDKSHYLQAFCTEVLRVWSPVGMTQRVAARATTIGTHAIPAGTTIIMSPAAINTSPALWGADAGEFKPERWLDSEGKANNRGSAESNYSFLTFLHGPRSCIGQRFAQQEFAALVAGWVGRFETEFERPGDWVADMPEIKGGVTSKPKAGLWVKVKEVEGW